MDKIHRKQKPVEGNDICILCKEVGETVAASSWCTDCEVTLCSRCAKMHVKAPATNDHEVTELSEGARVKPSALSLPVIHDIDIRHNSDSLDPDPYDVIIMHVRWGPIVVVADGSNNSIKSFYTRYNRNETSKLKLTGRPYRFAKISGHRIAVTVSEVTSNSTSRRRRGGVIAIAEVKPVLVLISSLTTSKQYWGITSLQNSQLAAGSTPPSAIDIFDLSGNILRSFTSHDNGLDILQFPFYLCSTLEGHILVSDEGSKSVFCMSSDGEIVFTYNPERDEGPENPKGIAIFKTGDILLADSEQGKIIQLTQDGTYIRDMLKAIDGIDNPWGLCADDNKLYVCQRGSCRCVSVFSFP